MSDLRSMLHEAAGPLNASTDASVADADLARARYARRRRRAGRIGAGCGLVLALSTFVFVVPGIRTGSPDGRPGGVSVASTALVSYTGKQPVGFTLDKVPAGWAVNDEDSGVLTLAPIGAKLPKNPGQGTDLRNKIAVMLQQGNGTAELPRTRVKVGNRTATIATMLGGHGVRTLYLKQPSGNYLTIQVWGGLGWNDDQIVQFAAAVHVTKDAQVGQG